MNIDNGKLYNAYLFGAKNVMENKNYLNKINVFPVADGDTGSNLSSTMKAIIRESKIKESVKDSLESIADAALGGARGNSGIIFAEYLNGVSIEMNSGSIITTEHFANANSKAVKYAYDAISNPVEGTMLTVIKVWADALMEFVHKATDFVELLTLSNERLEKSVINTQYQLSCLKKASVVDSGAKGFECFVKGILEFIKSGKDEVNQEIKDNGLVMEEIDAPLHSYEDLTYRYCTEATFKGDSEKLKLIKAELESLGDSLIVAGNDRIQRVHIHTDMPSRVFEALGKYVHVSYQKVDDMKLQSDMIANRKANIALVTDSIADLPEEFIDLHQIHVVSLNILFEDVSYLDKLTIKTDKLLEYSKDKELPTSSLPDVKQIHNRLSYLLSYYEQVLVMTVSSELSGTYDQFVKVAQKLSHEGKQVKVINTKQNSGAEGLLVMEAARLIEQGVEFEEIVLRITKSIEDSKIFVCIKTLENMIKSGRLSMKAGKIAKAIGMKPIITLDKDGMGKLSTVAFSFKSSQKKLKRHITKILKTRKIKSYSLVHVCNLDEAIAFAEELHEIIGVKAEYITETSAIVGIGAGIGAIGFSYILE